MFITFEGPDGSGKTLQIPALADFLRQRGFSVFTTREPGGTSIGDQIRRVLMDHANQAMHPRTEILLFLASRAQHVEEVIRPRLQNGEIVLCDRYTDSTLAYQGYGHQLDLPTLRKLNDFATGSLIPELTILLDLDAETGLKRKIAGKDWNRLDAYTLAFHQRVRQGYHELAKAGGERGAVVSAAHSPADVQQALRDVVLKSKEKNQPSFPGLVMV